MISQIAHHNYPALEFTANLREGVLAEQGRVLFALAQFLYFHPLVAPIWIAGLVFAFTDVGRAARPFGVVFLTMFTVLLILGGKPYYLASAYPAVLAAGGVAVERWSARRVWMWRASVASIPTFGLGLSLLALPLLPLRTVDAASAIGGTAQPRRRSNSRTTCTVSSVGSSTVLSVGLEPERGEVLIAYGIPRALLAQHYAIIEERDRIVAPGARPQDTDLPVYVCREPAGPIAALWSRLRRFGHGAL